MRNPHCDAPGVRITTFVCLTVAVVSAGCASNGDDGDAAVDSTSQAVVGGTETADDLAVVALIEGDQPYCSGTLVAPRAVLTAGHCLQTNEPTAVRVGTESIAVRETQKHPRFEFNGLVHDVAIVFLDKDAPATPATLSVSPSSGERVRIVGFGRASSSAVESEARKRTGFQKVDDVDAFKFRTRPDPATPCNGDSGGAVFDEQGALVGVISAGDYRCSNYALVTRVDAHRDFVDIALPPSNSEGGCSVTASRARSGSDNLPVALLFIWSLGFSSLVLRTRERNAS